jgi:glutamate-1-semialdehyde 2,1-aminomutase
MAAGVATLRHLREHPETYARLEKLTAQLAEGLVAAAKNAGIAVTLNRAASMFTAFFTDRPVTDWKSAESSDVKKFARFHGAMLELGIYLPPSQFEACMLSAAHGEAEVELALAAAKQAFAAVAQG